MVQNKTYKKEYGLKVLAIVLSILLLSTIAMATESTDEENSDAGAQAIAIGSETFATTSATVSDEGASAEAYARAKAENGETATAIAEAWAYFTDVASAYAKAVATAIAGSGETVWAEAYASASAEPSGESVAIAESRVGDLTSGDTGNDDDNKKIVSAVIKVDNKGSFMGFTFGKNDTERYCFFKQQLTDDDPDNDDRAKYYLWQIPWDNGGLSEEEFENKYLNGTGCGGNLNLKDRVKWVSKNGRERFRLTSN